MTSCSGAFLIRGGFVLLGLRSEDRASYPGVWDAIGGHAERGELPQETLARELLEEIGVTPTEFVEIATLSEPRPEINEEATFHMFVVTGWTGNGPVRRGDEHSEIRWFAISEAAEMDLAHPAYCELLRRLQSSLRVQRTPRYRRCPFLLWSCVEAFGFSRPCSCSSRLRDALAVEEPLADQ